MTEIMVDLHAIIEARICKCMQENDRLIKILEDESMSFEDKLIASNEAIINIKKFRELCGQETAL